MNAVVAVMMVFSILGALDRILGNRFGLGKEFEKGFMLLGTMALTMIGMIVLAPAITDVLAPLFTFFRESLHLDPSILPALFLINSHAAVIAKRPKLSEKLRPWLCKYRRFPTVGLPTQVPRVGQSPLSRKPAPPASLFATERGYYSIAGQDVNGLVIVLSLFSTLTEA